MSQSKRAYRLSENLLRGLTDEKKELVEDGFKSSRSFIDALANRIERKIEDSLKDSESVLLYKDPNWDLEQSHHHGYRQAMRDILNYFVDNKQRINND